MILTKLVIAICVVCLAMSGYNWYFDVPIVKSHVSLFLNDLTILLAWGYVYLLEKKCGII